MADAISAAPPAKTDLSTRLALLWATFFGVGMIPGAPGTYGTAAAVPFAYLLSKYSTLPWQLFTAVVVTLLGIVAASRAGRFFGVVDASHIVVDEVAGLLITMCGVRADQFTWQVALAGFVFFRVFDITKPWPAGYFDRKVKNGAGVMLDDVAAGVYSWIGLQLLMKYAPAMMGLH